MSSKKPAPTTFNDPMDAFAEIEALAREAQAIPGLRRNNAQRIATLGLKELGRSQTQGMRKLGAPPASVIQGQSKPKK